jgi:hypothetical protein
MTILKKIFINFWGLEREYLTDFIFFGKETPNGKKNCLKRNLFIFIFFKVCTFVFILLYNIWWVSTSVVRVFGFHC